MAKKAYCPKCGAEVFFDNGEAWCKNLHHLPGAPIYKRVSK